MQSFNKNLEIIQQQDTQNMSDFSLMKFSNFQLQARKSFHDLYVTANDGSDENITSIYYPLIIKNEYNKDEYLIYVDKVQLLSIDTEFWKLFFFDDRFIDVQVLYITDQESIEAVKIALDIMHYGNYLVLLNIDLDLAYQVRNFLTRFNSSLITPFVDYLDLKLSLYDSHFEQFSS